MFSWWVIHWVSCICICIVYICIVYISFEMFFSFFTRFFWMHIGRVLRFRRRKSDHKKNCRLSALRPFSLANLGISHPPDNFYIYIWISGLITIQNFVAEWFSSIYLLWGSGRVNWLTEEILLHHKVLFTSPPHLEISNLSIHSCPPLTAPPWYFHLRWHFL